VDERLASATMRVDAALRIGWNDGQVSRLTSAAGGVYVPADHIEDEDHVYYPGVPAIGQIPALRALINGISDSVEFGLSGLPSRIAEVADEQSHLAKGAAIYVGKLYWDDRWQMIGGPRWCWRGAAGTIRLRRAGGRIAGGRYTPPTWTISIEAGTAQIRRAGAQLSYWTDAQHQRLNPGDRFFQFVGYYNQGKRLPYPKA
jgi:hypothetical protein